MVDWYVPSGAPARKSHGASATIRAELDLIRAAMAKLPNYTGNANKMLAVNAGGTGVDAVTAAQARANIGLDGLDQFASLSYADGNFIVGDGASWVVESGATARTSLGLTIGTNVQAHDATLDALAGVTVAADQVIYSTGSDTFAVTSFTSTARSLLDDTSTSAMRTTLGLAIGSNVQAYDAGLNSIAGLTTAADKMIYTTASDTYAVADLTAAGRALLDDANAAAQLVTLGAQASSANLSAIAALAVTDGNVIVGNGSTWVAESGSTARTSLGAQAASANLDAIAALAVTDGNVIVGNGSTWVAESGSTARTSLGLGSIATYNVTIDTVAPSGGSDGDLWFQREA